MTVYPSSGVLRQYYNNDVDSWAWVRCAVRSGCLLAWREGTLPRRPAARLPLRDLHLRTAPFLPNAFQLSRLRDDSAVATFQVWRNNELNHNFFFMNGCHIGRKNFLVPCVQSTKLLLRLTLHLRKQPTLFNNFQQV